MTEKVETTDGDGGPDKFEELRGWHDEILQKIVESAFSERGGVFSPTQGALPQILSSKRFYNVTFLMLQIPNNLPFRLTPRELEISLLVSEGLHTKDIAEKLEINHATVSSHLRNIFQKLNVSTRAEMVSRLLLEEILTKMSTEQDLQT